MKKRTEISQNTAPKEQNLSVIVRAQQAQIQTQENQLQTQANLLQTQANLLQEQANLLQTKRTMVNLAVLQVCIVKF